MEERFEKLESRLIRIMTFGVSAMAVVVALLGTFIGVMAYQQGKQSDHLNNVDGKVEELKTDIGSVQLIAPDDHRQAVKIDKLTAKYNPVRGAKR